MENAVIQIIVKVLGTLGFPIMNWWRERQWRRRSEHWVMATGQLRFAKLENIDRWWSLYRASIGYAYSVNGQNYPGLQEMYFAWKGMGDQYVSVLHTGMTLTVRYDPVNPINSVLLMADQPMLSQHQH